MPLVMAPSDFSKVAQLDNNSKLNVWHMQNSREAIILHWLGLVTDLALTKPKAAYIPCPAADGDTWKSGKSSKQLQYFKRV